MRALKLVLLGLAVLPFAVNCSDKATAPRTDIITVAAEATNETLMAGTTTTVGITVTRPVGYVGPITLTTAGAPSGVTATLSPATLDANTNNSTLTLTVDAGAPNGTGSVTIRAVGTDISPQSATIQVNVGTAASGNFTLAVSPSSLTISRGGTSSAVIAIIPTGGFTGAVSLGVQGLPATISAAVSPSTTSSGSATLTLQVATTTQTGTYAGTISAQSSTGITQTAGFSVTVLSALKAAP